MIQVSEHNYSIREMFSHSIFANFDGSYSLYQVQIKLLFNIQLVKVVFIQIMLTVELGMANSQDKCNAKFLNFHHY